MNDAPNKSQLYLISGPSGSGKSTFIELAISNKLPPEFSTELNADIQHWPIIEANDILKNELSIEELATHRQQNDGLILHYDIVFIRNYTINSYDDDPAFSIFDKSDQLTLIYLKPPHNKLQEQLANRSRQQLTRKSPASRLWASRVRLPLRKLIARAKGRPLVETANLYRQSTTLHTFYLNWEKFLNATLANRPDAKLICVEPAIDTRGHPSFQIIRKQDCFETDE